MNQLIDINTNENKIQELITCKYCFNIFNNPYDTICCQETYCLKCIKEYISESKACKCNKPFNQEKPERNIQKSSQCVIKLLKIFESDSSINIKTTRASIASKRRSTLTYLSSNLEELKNGDFKTDQVDKVIDMLNNIQSYINQLHTPEQIVIKEEEEDYNNNVNNITVINTNNDNNITVINTNADLARLNDSKYISQGGQKLLSDVLEQIENINYKLDDVERDIENNYSLQKIMNKEINKCLIKLVDNTEKEKSRVIIKNELNYFCNANLITEKNGKSKTSEVSDFDIELTNASDFIKPEVHSWLDIYM
jgi:hypothetical protein